MPIPIKLVCCLENIKRYREVRDLRSVSLHPLFVSSPVAVDPRLVHVVAYHCRRNRLLRAVHEGVAVGSAAWRRFQWPMSFAHQPSLKP